MINNKLLMTSFAAVTFFSSSMIFADNRSPRLNSYYQIGGGQLGEAPSRIISGTSKIGLSFKNDMKCGEFDPKISISNQLNGITDGFKNMMSNIISSATGAVASLPGLALQKASPELYDMLQQGVLQGKMDFEWVETSCEQMQRVMLGEESFPFNNFKLSAEYDAWFKASEDSDGDAIKAKDKLDEVDVGDNGVNWLCGDKRGGLAQAPITAINDVILAGYNLIFDRSNSCDTSAISSTLSEGSAIAKYWNTPLKAQEWVKEVVGDYEFKLCKGCDKMTGVPGKGLLYKYSEQSIQIAQSIARLVDGTNPLTYTYLQAVSAPPGVMVQAPVIHSIRRKGSVGRNYLINTVASDIAYIRMVEQAKLATRLLMTGIKEPDISGNQKAVDIVKQAIEDMQIELSQLDIEVKRREKTAGGTIKRLMLLEEKEVLETSTPPSGSRKRTSITGEIQ